MEMCAQPGRASAAPRKERKTLMPRCSTPSAPTPRLGEICDALREVFGTYEERPISDMHPPIRVLVAKPGLDGHDRGAKIIARALRDAGMEVIYTGLRQTPEMIVNAALQEDVQVIGLSILSGAHNAIVPRVLELLREKDMAGVKVIVGGIIPDEDAEAIWNGRESLRRFHPSVSAGRRIAGGDIPLFRKYFDFGTVPHAAAVVRRAADDLPST
jgi:methylmalonyl-CoA mutase, C-terminal domain